MPTPQRMAADIQRTDWKAEFWQHVDRRGKNECWLWLGRVGTNGYGEITIDGVTYKVHRLAFESEVRPLRDGFMACHHCDNRLCCNFYHLFEGTNSDNMRDAVVKGKLLGVKRFDDGTIQQIREMYATKLYTQLDLAERFLTDQSHISRIVNRILYK